MSAIADEDKLDAEDIAALDESERQIASGEDLDWKEISTRLRQMQLREQ